MDSSIWEMQQEAARRVERMREAGRRAVAGQPTFAEPRRTAASLRANRPPPYRPLNRVSPPYSSFTPENNTNHNLPPSNHNLPLNSQKGPDREQLLLLILTLFLAKNGGSPQLILALLYLTF